MLRLSVLVAYFAVFLLVAASSADQIPFVDNDVSTTGSGWSWQSCGSSDDMIDVYSIEVTPDPPVPGKEMTLVAKGNAKEEVGEGALADVTVKLGLITLLKKTFDICEEARKGNATIQCPIEEGEHVVKQTVALPSQIPRTKFKVNVDAYMDDTYDPILCLDLEIDFSQNR